MSILDLQVGDVVHIVQRRNFNSRLKAGDTLEVLRISGDHYLFKVLTCEEQRLVGAYQTGAASWLVHSIRKLPKLKEVPHDITTPLKVGDYVEVICQDSDEVGLIKKVVGFNDAGYIRTLSQSGPFAGQEIWYTRREYLSLIK